MNTNQVRNSAVKKGDFNHGIEYTPASINKFIL